MSGDREKENIFSYFQSESPMATEMRRLYHNARAPLDGVSPKSFLITSSNRGEGKSTIAAYLAVTIAQFPKKKILLVDADLRRPRIRSLFGLERDRGLKDCLESGVDPIEVAQQTPLANLQVITAGSPSRTPGELFESEALSEVIRKVSFYYDVVLVDSAPVLAVSDTLFLVSDIDKVLLVVLAGVTPREVVIRARNVLLDSNARIGGVILNNASAALPFYYDYKYYGREYK